MTICNKCDAEIKDNSNYTSDDLREFNLTSITGWYYHGPSGGGEKKGWQVDDLCNDCAEWLKNLLIENGVKLSEVKLYW